MKRILLALSAVLLLSPAIRAQIQIGAAEMPTGGTAGRLDDDDLETFKKTTTVFVVQTKDAEHVDDFEQGLKGVWTITPYKVITPDQMGDYSDGHRYSYFSFGGFVVSSRYGTYTHLSYDLSIDRFKKNGDTKGRTLLARFYVSPDPETLEQSERSNHWFTSKKWEREMLRFMYTQSVFRNWGPGYLRGYAKFINDALVAQKRRGTFDSDHDKNRMKVLAKDTLWLPTSIKLRYKPMGMFGTGNREEEDAWDDADLHKAYPYRIAYIDDAALQDKILYGGKPVYYLVYARSATEKYVNIFEGKSGDQIYTEHSSMSYNIKLKDLRRIAEIID